MDIRMDVGIGRLLAVLAFLTVAASTCGASDPQVHFRNPPKEAHAGVWWHWMGAQVTRDGIEKDLDWFERMGITSATIFGMADATVPWAKRIANVPTGGLRPYSDEWWRLVAFACAEGKKRGIDMGLHNCPGYTSSGGKWIPPRLAMRELVFDVKDPAHDISVTPSALFPVYNEEKGAFEKPDCPARRDDYQPIAVVRGVVVGHVPTGSYVQPTDWDSFGLECDKMNPEAVAFHMDHVIAEWKRHLGPNLRDAGLQHVLLDSYEAGTPTWTPKMREEFKARRGYDPLDFLPVLGGYTNLYTAAESMKFKADFDRTVRELYRDVLFKIMHEKLSAEGLQFSCEPYTGPFSSEEAAQFIDRIMTEFWLDTEKPPHGCFNVLAAPGGRRHNIVEAEAFTSVAPWDETPASLKARGDSAWLAGVNRFVLHSCVQQPWSDDVKPGVTMGRWGAHFGRTQTWAESGRAWLDYIARAQALLQWGKLSAASMDVPFAQIARTDGKRTIYFLVNDSAVGKSLELPEGGRWFDPIDGNVGEPPPVLAPRQSGFFESPERVSPLSPRARDAVAEGCRRFVTISDWVPKLGDWTKSDNPEIRYFSGTKTYRARFDLPDGRISPCAQAELELGQVLCATAQVRVNGRNLGVVWCEPWRVKVPVGILQIGANIIEIDVTNVWRNRLIGDEQEPSDVDFAKAPCPGGDMMLSYPEWFKAGIAARPSKGRRCFTTWRYFTADSKLVPSGLVGPVRIHVASVTGVSVALVAPADGATLPLLTADMKNYLAMDRAKRKTFFADKESRVRMSKWGDKPLPVKLKWTGPAGTRYKVVVTREPDGKVFFKGKTSRTEIDVWNLEIARTYNWRVTPEKKDAGTGARGRFSTEDIAPRLVKVDGIPNLRDIGGRKGLDGRRVRQGMVYRSAGLNSNANSYYTPTEITNMLANGTLVNSVPEKSKETAKEIAKRAKAGKPFEIETRRLVKDWHPGRERLNAKTRAYMRETLGIKTDIDLRTDRECYGMTGSPLGEGVRWVQVPFSPYRGLASDSGKKAFANVFKVFLDEANYPIDFHCIAGADRTGSLAYVLNALLGVDEDELWKDWEVTALRSASLDFGHASRFEKLLSVFAGHPGATARERVEAYVKEQGFTDADLAKFRTIMLEN